MSIMQDPKFAGIIQRIKNILFDPKSEWAKIETESSTITVLFKDYVLILAAVPALCHFVGAVVFGYGYFGVSIHPSFFGALSIGVSLYIQSILSVIVLAFAIDFLAPTFQAQKSQIQAFKVASYSMTAAWVAGIFSLVPHLDVLGLLGLYSLYLLYCGLPTLMKSPQDKTMPYFVVVIVITIVANIVLHSLIGPSSSMGGNKPDYSMSGAISLPNGVKVDMSALDKLSKSEQDAQKSPSVQPISGEELKALLPAALTDGFARSNIEASSFSAGDKSGISASSVNATYQHDKGSIRLSITDISATGFAGLAGALSVENSEETATSYSKAGKVDGRMTMEKFDRTYNTGEYSVLVANRFMVEASGSGGANMDEMKAAVKDLISPLENLAKSKS